MNFFLFFNNLISTELNNTGALTEGPDGVPERCCSKAEHLSRGEDFHRRVGLVKFQDDTRREG